MKCLIISIITDRFLLEDEKGQEIIAQVSSKLRLKENLLVGDFVECEKFLEHYQITKLYERKNSLIRPKVANVDLALIVMSLKEPEFSYELVNRLLMQVDYFKVEPLILVSKCDLGDEKEFLKIKNYYEPLGYRVFGSSLNNELNETLLNYLKDKIVVLCGQSGVGKSSFINRLCPDLNLKTQGISYALNRGKHTTRFNRLYHYHDTYIDDSPGFSSLDLNGIDETLLADRIKAFAPYLNKCRFIDCRHLKEPYCAIKEAVQNNLIPSSFYETYTHLMDFLKNENYYGNRHRTLK